MNPEQFSQLSQAMSQTPQGLPAMPEGMPPEDVVLPDQDPVSEDQMEEVEDIIEDLYDAKERLDALSFDSKSKAEKLRLDLLKRVFTDLQRVGVDLEDQGSVADFIQKLRTESPELAAQFENSMDVLLGNDEPQEPVSMEEPVDINDEINPEYNEDETLPQDLRGQV